MGWIRRTRTGILGLALAAVLLLGGCTKASDLPQTPFDPKGPVAREQLQLLNLSMYFAIGIGVVVSALLLFVIFKFRARPETAKTIPAQIHGNTKLEIIWTLIPIVILIIVGVPTVQAAFYVWTPPANPDVNIQAVGHQWWFEFQYPGEKFVTANEMYIPVGKPVKIGLTSADVIHSFSIPKLAGRMDMIPNRQNELWLQADEEGTYYAQCTELCGVSHAYMQFRVVALSPEKYAAWVKERQAGAKEPTDPLAVKGKEVMTKQDCIACHSIDGTALKAKVGPNLTNVGARQTIAAGMYPNEDSYLKQWIRDPQSLKPGVTMPAHAKLTDDELTAIVAYLRSLK